MKRIFATLGVVLMLWSLCGCDSGEGEENAENKMVDIEMVAPTDTVLICTGSAAKRFHSRENCEGRPSSP